MRFLLTTTPWRPKSKETGCRVTPRYGACKRPEQFALVDAHQPTNAGESWLIAVEEIAETAAKDLTVGVIRGLGRDKVEITPVMLNGRKGHKIDTWK